MVSATKKASANIDNIGASRNSCPSPDCSRYL